MAAIGDSKRTYSLLAAILMLTGCATDYGQELSTVIRNPDGRIFLDKDKGPLVIKLREDLAKGRQTDVAELMLSRARWGDRVWFRVAEEEYASIWRHRAVPIRVSANDRTMQALTEIAEHGGTRSSRVDAAIAILEERPDLARAVLARDYANMELEPYRKWRWHREPQAAGPYIDLPSEIVSSHEVADELLLAERRKFDPYSLLRTANAYNKHLLLLKQRGDMEALKELDEGDNRRKLLRTLYDDALNSPPQTEPSRGGNIFGHQ